MRFRDHLLIAEIPNRDRQLQIITGELAFVYDPELTAAREDHKRHVLSLDYAFGYLLFTESIRHRARELFTV